MKFEFCSVDLYRRIISNELNLNSIYNFQLIKGNMSSKTRGIRNQKPQSTWKGGIAAEGRKGQQDNQFELVQTADLSKMDSVPAPSKITETNAKGSKSKARRNDSQFVSNKQNRKLRKGLVEGNIDQANENYFRDNISDDYYKPLGICGASLKHLNKHGASVRVYFSFMQQMTLLALVLGAVGGLCCYINFFQPYSPSGGYYNGTNKNDKSDALRSSQERFGRINFVTIANFAGYTNNTLDPQALNWINEQKTDFVSYVLLDTILTITLVSWVFFFKVFAGVTADKINSDNIQASIYAVEVRGLPTTIAEGAPNEFELKSHFSQFGPVHSVSFVRNTGSLLEVYQRAQAKLYEAEVANETNKVKQSLDVAISTRETKRPADLRTEYYELLNIGQLMNPLRQKLDMFPIESAIIIFEKPNSREVCLLAHRDFAPKHTLNCCRRVPLDFLFRGHYHLTVGRPPEPYAIYWDNYHQSMVRKLVFGLFLTVLTLLFLSITIGATYALHALESASHSTYCPKQYLYAKLENVQTKEEAQFINNCFCERLDVVQLVSGWQEKYQSQCPEYLAGDITYYYACYGVVVVLINWALKKIVEFGATWLKFTDITAEAKFQMTMLYLLQFFNLTIPLMLVNFDFTAEEWVTTVHQELIFDYAGPRRGGVFFFNGKHQDTNREWLNQINKPLHFVLVMVLLGSIVYSWVGSCCHRVRVQVRARSKYLQCEYDELYAGKEFPHHLKLGQHLAYTSCVLVFSAALPSLLGLLPLYFLSHYWVDKWLILRVCRMPPRFDVSINDRASNILGFAAILHIICSVLAFATPAIFPRQIYAYDAYSGVKQYYVKPWSSALERFLNPMTRPVYLPLLIITVGALFLVEPVALQFAKTCCFRPPRRGQRLRHGTLRTYSIESMQQQTATNSFSYDMMKSRRYRRGLLLLNQQDIDEADDLEEREQAAKDAIADDPYLGQGQQ